MPFSLLKLSKLHLIALSVVMVVGIAVFGFQYSKQFRLKHETLANATLSSAIIQTSTADFTTLGINLTRFGFEPAAANVSKGKYLFSVRNMTGLESVTLTITRSNGDKIISDKTKNERKRWDQVVDLTPGDYVLSVAENPLWAYTLTVLPPGKQ